MNGNIRAQNGHNKTKYNSIKLLRNILHREIIISMDN